MFNALNRFMSRLDGEDPRQKPHQQGLFGFQVLRNANLQLAIEPWFDFVVGINGRMIVWHPLGRLERPGEASILNNTPRTTRAPASLRKRFATVREEACH